jgi:hypothetical protein
VQFSNQFLRAYDVQAILLVAEPFGLLPRKDVENNSEMDYFVFL